MLFDDFVRQTTARARVLLSDIQAGRDVDDWRPNEWLFESPPVVEPTPPTQKEDRERTVISAIAVSFLIEREFSHDPVMVGAVREITCTLIALYGELLSVESQERPKSDEYPGYL